MSVRERRRERCGESEGEGRGTNLDPVEPKSTCTGGPGGRNGPEVPDGGLLSGAVINRLLKATGPQPYHYHLESQPCY